MAESVKNSSLTTRLFLEGIEVDLDTEIDIANTYAVSDVRSIGSKKSNFSKSITLPGTARNNRLFGFLYDVKSITDSFNDFLINDGSIQIANFNSDTASVYNCNFAGTTFTFPIDTATSQNSYHNQINNDYCFIDISGHTDDSGYVWCILNGIVIASNKINAATSRYYFPQGFYLFTDQLIIAITTEPGPIGSNIAYNLDFKKKMRANVVQDNAIIFSGYAKILSATQTNGLAKFSIQITSDLGGMIAQLANLRLEDLYTTISPDLTADPTGQTGRVIDIASPYDHTFNLVNVVQSWYDLVPYTYPLIDYGNDDTVFQTNFYTSNFRPCLHAKDYLDRIFETAGFTYSSSFLESDYFSKLIIPYKDGNISIIDVYKVEASNDGFDDEYDVIPDVVAPQDNDFYTFDKIISDTYGVYSGHSYTATIPGTYNVGCQITANYSLNPSGAGSNIVGCPEFTTFILFEVFPASGGTDPVNVYTTIYDQPQFGTTVSGNPAFVGSHVSDKFLITIPSVPVFVPEAGGSIRVRISPTAPHQTAGTFFPDAANPSTTYAGDASFNVVYDPTTTGVISVLDIEYSGLLDNQYVKFKDFVPKSVKQIDYVNSIVKLFNLYPVQDPNIRNRFNIYTRDEFYANQNTLDWTQKTDLLSDVTVTPIPELDASQLLFSYKKGTADWFNKQYNSLYGDYAYGSLRIQTGYDFANTVNDVLDGVIFEPTPLVEMGIGNAPSEGSIEILNTLDIVTFPNSDNPSNIILASGYYAANGSFSPYTDQLSVPVSNNFNGTPFKKAKVGVHILYWGIEYIISQVFNDYAFEVVSASGNQTVLYRPVTQGSDHRINDTYYATNDGFTYLTNSNISIPAIYDSSDNNATHKPVTTEMKILYFQPLTAFTAASYNSFFLQYTPIVVNGIYTYQNRGTDPGVEERQMYPYCGHLNDPVTPTFDLNFGKPIAVFFGFPFDGNTGGTFGPSATTDYPASNLYTRFWINTANEIIDPEAKFVDCMMNLQATDIASLDLSKKIYINGTNYRINKIEDYSPDASLTKVELIRSPKTVSTNTNIFVYAGADQILSGSTFTSFAGIARPGNDGFGGEIVETLWTFISGPIGPSPEITTPSSLLSTVTGLFESEGTFVFQLYARDSYGQSATDIMEIRVVGSIPCLPFASAEASPSGITLAVEAATTTLIGGAEGCGGGDNPLRLLFTNIASVPVDDATSLSDWNAFFQTSTNADVPFLGVSVIDNEVYLVGAVNLIIPDSLFQESSALVRIKDEGTAVFQVGYNAFNTATVLTEVDLPGCVLIHDGGFLNASALTTLNLPSVNTIGTLGFGGCTALTGVTLPFCTSIGIFAFGSCTSLLSASLPQCITVGDSAFQTCSIITDISIPVCTALGSDVFDTSVFHDISGNNITLTIPAATSTDSDVLELQAHNTVTLILT